MRVHRVRIVGSADDSAVMRRGDGAPWGEEATTESRRWHGGGTEEEEEGGEMVGSTGFCDGDGVPSA